jgi:hypothetical protein
MAQRQMAHLTEKPVRPRHPTETTADEAIIDGRETGLPPQYEQTREEAPIDSPAMDAAIQSDSETSK